MVQIATLDSGGKLTPAQVPALATLGATATGEALIEAVDAAAARTAIGATAAGSAVLTAANAAAQLTALGAQPAADLDTDVTALDANAASALRVQQDARLTSTFGAGVESAALRKGQKLAAITAGRLAETAPGVTAGTIATLATASQCSPGTVTFTESGQVIETSADHGFSVGDRIAFSGIAGITGQINDTDAYYVKTAPTATTLTVSYTSGGSARTFTGDGTASGVARRAYCYDAANSAMFSGMLVTEGSAVQASASWPRTWYIKPDPATVTYSPGVITGTGLRVIIQYAGTKIDILTRRGGLGGGRILVDGREAADWAMADLSGAGVSTGGVARIPLTFVDARTRVIEVVLPPGAAEEFVGFDYDSTGAPTYPYSQAPKGARWLIAGDSFTEGTGADIGWGFTRWLAEHMGWQDVWVCGSGSTGYVTDGTRTSLSDRYTNDIINQSPTGVIIAMGINDKAAYQSSPSTVTTAATTVWDAILATSTIQTLVVVGPWPTAGGSPVDETMVAMDAELKTLAAARDIQYISPVSEGWTFTLSDSTHPDADGHELLGRRVAGHLSL